MHGVKCHFQHSVTEQSCEEKHSLSHKKKLASQRDRTVNFLQMLLVSKAHHSLDSNSFLLRCHYIPKTILSISESKAYIKTCNHDD